MSTAAAPLIARSLAQLPLEGPVWLLALRRQAAEAVREGGLPTEKDEAWRFTSLKPIAGTSFAMARDALVALPEQAGEGWRLPVLNGVPHLSEAGAPPEGVEVAHFSSLLRDQPGLVEAHLGHYTRGGPFSSLNTAVFEDGVLLRIKRGAKVSTTLRIEHLAVPGQEPLMASPRLLVLCEPESECHLLERYQALPGEPHLTNAVAEIMLGEAARLAHTRVHQTGAAMLIGTTAVQQARDSSYLSRVVTLGGALMRLDLDVKLVGDGASCVLQGVYHAGSGEHLDHHTYIEHAAPYGTSRELYRGIADGNGEAVFDGTITVRPGAQRTNAEQQNRNLLLSDQALIHTKPHLDILTDDVMCSHGVTVGALDEAQIFYLRSRNIGEEQARAMLTLAFVRGIIEAIPEGVLAAQLMRALMARLPYRYAVAEGL